MIEGNQDEEEEMTVTKGIDVVQVEILTDKVGGGIDGVGVEIGLSVAKLHLPYLLIGQVLSLEKVNISEWYNNVLI